MNGLREPYYPALLRVRLSLTLTDSVITYGNEPLTILCGGGCYPRRQPPVNRRGCYVARFHPGATINYSEYTGLELSPGCTADIP